MTMWRTGGAMLVVVLLASVTLLAAGCGGGTTTTTQAVTSTTEAVPTTQAPSTTVPTTPAGQSGGEELVQYATEMAAWGTALEELPVTEDLPDDMTQFTEADEQTAKNDFAQIQALGDQLHAIEAPAALTAPHQELVAGFDALLAEFEKVMVAVEARDQAAFDAAFAKTETAALTLGAVVDEWSAALEAAMSAS